MNASMSFYHRSCSTTGYIPRNYYLHSTFYFAFISSFVRCPSLHAADNLPTFLFECQSIGERSEI